MAASVLEVMVNYGRIFSRVQCKACTGRRLCTSELNPIKNKVHWCHLFCTFLSCQCFMVCLWYHLCSTHPTGLFTFRSCAVFWCTLKLPWLYWLDINLYSLTVPTLISSSSLLLNTFNVISRSSYVIFMIHESLNTWDTWDDFYRPIKIVHKVARQLRPILCRPTRMLAVCHKNWPTFLPADNINKALDHSEHCIPKISREI